MSTPAESFATVGLRAQEAATSALCSWVDGLQTFAGGESVLSDMPGTISRYFDAAQQVLDSQRQLAETMATAMQTMQTNLHKPGCPGRGEHHQRYAHCSEWGRDRHESGQRANQRNGAHHQGRPRLRLLVYASISGHAHVSQGVDAGAAGHTLLIPRHGTDSLHGEPRTGVAGLGGCVRQP